MAGRIVRETSTSITAAGASGLTVTTTAGFYEKAYAYLAAVGQPGEVVQIVRILTGTTMTVRRVLDPRGGGASNQSMPSNAGTGQYGTFNASSYAPGTITMPEQVIQNPNDKPLD